MLGYFKYKNFFLGSLNDAIDTDFPLVSFAYAWLGVLAYTFQIYFERIMRPLGFVLTFACVVVGMVFFRAVGLLFPLRTPLAPGIGH